MKKLFILFTILCPTIIFGQYAGDQVFNSLNIPGAARIAALGGTYIPAQDDDLELGIFNPSVLDSGMTNQLALSYVNYFSNNLGYVAYARNIDSLITMSASLRFMNYGQFDRIDAAGNDLGEFYVADLYATVGAGIEIDTNWRVGANLKFLYANYEKYNSFGVAADLAATYYNPDRRFTAVFILKNAGVQLKTFTGDEKEKLPTEFQIGISKKLLHAPFRFSIMGENLQTWDLSYGEDSETTTVDPITGEEVGNNKFTFGDRLMRHLVFGGEILLTDNFEFRFGYNYRRRQEMKVNTKPGTAGFSFGAGIRLKRFKLSYARSTYHIAGASNHFSLSTVIGNR